MKNKITTVILIIILLAGLSLLLYPTVSDYWNSFHATRAVATYEKEVADLNEEEYNRILADAAAYNQALASKEQKFELSAEEKANYEKQLDFSDTGMMGYLEIPAIHCTLPIYHGSSDEVLQIAVGHLEWSSLPVGGESSHCVLSGHRGLPSAKLLSNLDRLTEGDTFMLKVLNETLTYEVDQILIVLPEETDALLIEDGKDLCTLVTCTPYGINTHRLLVRGHRVANTEDAAKVTADALRITPLYVVPLIAVPLLLVAFILLFVADRKRKSRGGESRESKK